MKPTVPEPPRATNKAAMVVDLTGKLFPCAMESADGIVPAFLCLVGSPHLYLPCFSTESALLSTMQSASTPFVKIKHIDDGRLFLDEFPRSIAGQEIKIMLDPYRAKNGRLRWTEVKWN